MGEECFLERWEVLFPPLYLKIDSYESQDICVLS